MEAEPRVVQEEDGEEQQQQPPLPTGYLRCLYVGYFLARWGARMWEFSVGLYMIHIWPNSLLLAAIYGAVESGSTAAFGPIVGQWVGRLTYVKVLRLWLVSKNLSFIVAGGSLVALFIDPDLKFKSLTAFISLVVLINVSGAIGMLSALAGTILIERDWVVVISEGHPPSVLTKMNSVIRAIDLSSKLLAPVITGLLISFVSLTASALAFAIWATLTVWFEYWLFVYVYKGIPALVKRNQRRIAPSIAPSSTEEEYPFLSNTQETDNSLPSPEEETYRRRCEIVERILKSPFVSAWRVYLKQEVVLPGVALALLFFTVLSFGTLMTATLEWDGIPTYIIGIGRGISAVVGLAATLVYPVMQSRLSTAQTGLWSIWSQWGCLLLCVGSAWMKKRQVAAYMLMAGVATSRLGLWMFDLAVMQQMQDLVPESDRFVVGGVQNSLQSAMDLAAYVMGIIVSNPQDFWKLTLVSVVAVTAAALLYTLHLNTAGRHHFDLENSYHQLESGDTPTPSSAP